MNAAQVTAYLALQDEVKKLRKTRSNRNKKSKRSNRKSEDDTTSGEGSPTEVPIPPPPIVNSILRHKRKHKSDNNGKVYAIHDSSSTTDDNNHYIPGPAIAPTPDNDFRHDLNNDHNISNNISYMYDIADGDIDSLQNLRNKHHNSDTRGDCLDDFITYYIAPELKTRPSYEDCLRENEENELVQIEEMNLRDDEEENELIQIDAMMIQPSISESSTEDAISNSLPEHSRLSLMTRVSRHVDNFLRKQGASDLQIPTLCQSITPSLWFKAIRATSHNEYAHQRTQHHPFSRR